MIDEPTLLDEAIKFRKGIPPKIVEYLEQHGCIISPFPGYDLIAFPEGTTELEQPPRTLESRYLITLPDGMVCYRQCLCSRADVSENGLSVLFFPKEVKL